ncbi:hypothetical protein JCM19236_3403 [Vibrio sp. JCM 19236]|nr:hypothetical protein JCM19236_3403 [Vibrio sp. JCM 19236]
MEWNKLAINSGSLRVNGEPQKVTNLRANNKTASWVLSPSQISAVARLYQDQLLLSFDASSHAKIMRNQPVTLSWFDLAEHKTQTLLLPFSEGMRVPTTSQHWGNS